MAQYTLWGLDIPDSHNVVVLDRVARVFWSAERAAGHYYDWQLIGRVEVNMPPPSDKWRLNIRHDLMPCGYMEGHGLQLRMPMWIRKRKAKSHES